jgi:NAD(P)-dependent dehydrogenase (short-subunit alcohol dehydrogenase family)
MTSAPIASDSVATARAHVAVVATSSTVVDREENASLEEMTFSTLPRLIEGGRGGAIVLTSSTAGLKGTPNTIHYTAVKHGIVGVMRTLANECAPHSIRVNTAHPTGADMVMVQNEKTWGPFAPDDPAPSREKAAPAFESTNALPVPWVEPVDISNATLFLISNEACYVISDGACYVTGVTLHIDAGCTVK